MIVNTKDQWQKRRKDKQQNDTTTGLLINLFLRFGLAIHYTCLEVGTTNTNTNYIEFWVHFKFMPFFMQLWLTKRHKDGKRDRENLLVSWSRCVIYIDSLLLHWTERVYDRDRLKWKRLWNRNRKFENFQKTWRF